MVFGFSSYMTNTEIQQQYTPDFTQTEMFKLLHHQMHSDTDYIPLKKIHRNWFKVRHLVCNQMKHKSKLCAVNLISYWYPPSLLIAL